MKYKNFIEENLQIVNKEGQTVDLILNSIQNKYLEECSWHDDILKARQQGFCLDKNTKILTADLRWVRIEDIKIGQEIISVDEETPGGRGNSRNMVKAIVEAKRIVHENAHKLTMDNGESLIATAEHRFLSKRSSRAIWKPVKRFKVGQNIRYITKLWKDPTLEDAWFSGILDGEGSIRAKKSGGAEVSVNQVAGIVWDRIKEYAKNSGFSYRIDWDNRKPGITSKFGKNPVGKITFSRMNELFELVGKTRPTRFIDKQWWIGKNMPGKRSGKAWTKVLAIENLGEREMIDLQTSTKTFIANGFVSHNSSLITGIFFCDFLLVKNSFSVILADREENAVGLLEKVKFYIKCYEHKNKVKVPLKYNSESKLYNPVYNSWYIVGTANNYDFGRSKTITNLLCSEISRYSHIDKVMAGCVQAVVENGKVILETTANGFNEYKKNREGNKMTVRGYKKLFYKASDFYTPQFLAKKKLELGDTYLQEYPETEMDAFISSGLPYFDKNALAEYLKKAESPIACYQ